MVGLSNLRTANPPKAFHMFLRSILLATVFCVGLFFSPGREAGFIPLAIPQALAQISEKEAFESAKELGTADAWKAFLSSFPDGFRADLAKAYLKKLEGGESNASDDASGTDDEASADREPDKKSTDPETASVKPAQIRVGKWPERLAHDGTDLWVSESGQRSISQINPEDGEVVERYSVGRLPVDMAATSDGRVFALNNTDNKIWVRENGKSKARVFASIPRCAELMASDGSDLWAVANTNCSSPSVLYKVSGKSRKVRKQADLEGGVADMVADKDYVYISHTTVGDRKPFVTLVEAGTGDVFALSPASGIHYGRLALGDDGVFVAGAPLGNAQGFIRKLPKGSPDFTSEATTSEPIRAVTAAKDYVIAAGEQGTIYVLTQSDLSLVKTIRLTGVGIEAHDILAVGDMLYIASFRNDQATKDYVVFALSGWAPGKTVSRPTFQTSDSSDDDDDGYSDDAQPQQQQRQPKPLKCGKNYKLQNGRCVLLQNCGRNAYRSAEGDCYCNRGFEMRNGRCRRERLKCGKNYKLRNGRCVLLQNCGKNAYRSPEGDCYCKKQYEMVNGRCRWKQNKNGFEIEPWKKPGCKSYQRKCNQGNTQACLQYESNCQVN